MPKGLSADAILSEAYREFAEDIDESIFYSRVVKVTGHANTGIALFLGAKLANISKHV